MKQSKVEMFGMPLLWSAGLGAVISYGFQVPFLDVAGLLYFGFLFANMLSWRSGRDGCRDHAQREEEAARSVLEERMETIQDIQRRREPRHGTTGSGEQKE